ncbi:coiled-coil domain-containing protein 39-like [Folsomia candida]|uniref:coiled-coil domain-containing protein 39-like n=1 Tax=Folsomia candida TaxID=158441 RepID=UPI00160511D9|nr:coiled-coil domain-containing protein 39-like [Folsomia candida]
MWQGNISKMLSQTGLGTGFRLPVANADNIALEKELEKRHHIVQLKRSDLDDIARHSDILERGIRNAIDHIAHDKKLLAAKCAEVTAESELVKASERDAHNLARECKFVDETYKKAAAHNRALIGEIESKKYDVSELAEMIEFDRQELILMENKAADETQVMKSIEEIGDQDSETLRKNETRYRKATAEWSSMRLELDGKVALTSMMQADLDGLSERFRKLHKERGDIVALWKDTLIALNEKDGEMKDIAEEYTSAVAYLHTLKQKGEEQQKKLEDGEKSSELAAIQLAKWDRKVNDLREELKNTADLSTLLKDNLYTYETTISYTSKQLQEMTAKMAKLEAELAAMHDKICVAEEALAKLRAENEANSGQLFSAAERIRQIEELIDEEERRTDSLEKKMAKEIMKKNQWVNQRSVLETESLDVDHEIKGMRFNLQNLLTRTKDAGNTLERRKATIYRMELQYINAEVKYLPMMNPKQDTIQFKEQEERLLVLKLDMDQTLKQKAFVTVQTDRILHVHRRIAREKVTTERDIAGLEQKSNEHRCLVKFSVKNLEYMVGEYQGLMVAHSLLKLKLTQMIQALKEQKNFLYDADNQRVLLQAAVKEKRSEIDAHTRLLELKRRGVKDELCQLKLQICQVSACVDKRKKRYDIIMQLMGRQDEVAGEEKSEAYYVLKMAQEREVLLMEVQKWKNRLTDAEKEIEGLSNVHKVMNASNSSLKDSLAPAPEESEEVKALDRLTAQEQEILLRRSRAHKYRALLRDKMSEVEQKIVIAEQEIRATMQFSDMKEALASKLHNELQRQREKVVRWNGICSRVIKEIKPLFPPEQFDLLQNDLKLRFTVSKFESAIGMLERLLFHHPYVKKYFVRRIQQDSGLMKLYDRFSQSLSISSSSRSSSSSSSSSVSSATSTTQSPGGTHRVKLSTSVSGSSMSSSVRTNPSTAVKSVTKMTPFSRINVTSGSKQKVGEQAKK